MPDMYKTGQDAGDQVSSTYEGRHISVAESNLVHPTHTDGFVDKGDPVIWGENIVGVAFKSAAVATDLIAIDTEGVWYLAVVGSDDAGDQAIARGDEVFINKTDGILSANSNKQSHARFGYALLPVTGGATTVIAVKVHWNADDAQELVGTTAAPETNDEDGHTFREYRYESAATGGAIHGDYLRLNIAGAVDTALGGRSNLNISAAIVNAYGRHDTVAIKAAGSITGLAVGHRAGYLASDAAQAATIAGAMSELWAEGASTDYATATEHSIHRFVNDGEATGKATAENVWAFAGLSSTQLQSHSAWVAGLTQVLRVVVDGNVRYVGLSTAA